MKTQVFLETLNNQMKRKVSVTRRCTQLCCSLVGGELMPVPVAMYDITFVEYKEQLIYLFINDRHLRIIYSTINE